MRTKKNSITSSHNSIDPFIVRPSPRHNDNARSSSFRTSTLCSESTAVQTEEGRSEKYFPVLVENVGCAPSTTSNGTGAKKRNRRNHNSKNSVSTRKISEEPDTPNNCKDIEHSTPHRRKSVTVTRKGGRSCPINTCDDNTNDSIFCATTTRGKIAIGSCTTMLSIFLLASLGIYSHMPAPKRSHNDYTKRQNHVPHYDLDIANQHSTSISSDAIVRADNEKLLDRWMRSDVVKAAKASGLLLKSSEGANGTSDTSNIDCIDMVTQAVCEAHKDDKACYWDENAHPHGKCEQGFSTTCKIATVSGVFAGFLIIGIILCCACKSRDKAHIRAVNEVMQDTKYEDHNSNLLMYALIGGGTLLLLIIVGFVVFLTGKTDTGYTFEGQKNQSSATAASENYTDTDSEASTDSD